MSRLVAFILLGCWFLATAQPLKSRASRGVWSSRKPTNILFRKVAFTNLGFAFNPRFQLTTCLVFDVFHSPENVNRLCGKLFKLTKGGSK